jgi:hypothetical protein
MTEPRQDIQSTKITKETLRQLRVISARLGEPQYRVLARLVQVEYEKVEREAQEQRS